MEGRPLSESGVVDRARRGDGAAFEELVRTYSDVAFRTAYVITGSAADAEEAAQDGFLKARRALESFRTGAPFRPWLLTIVANEARNRVRAAKRRSEVELRFAKTAAEGDAAPSPDAVVLAGVDRDRLAAAVRRLGDDDRRVIALRYFLQLSVSESAAALGVPEGTVKSRLARALARLREEFDGAA